MNSFHSNQRNYSLNLFLIGYKLCQQISKALQYHSEAICFAIEWYNNEAKKLVPPAPQLSWKQIANYTFLAEFDILRLRLHLQDEPWVKPAHREATVKYFKMCQSREELICLHVEIQQLQVAIQNEAMQTQQVLKNLATENPSLYAELSCRWKLCLSINDIHLQQLAGIKKYGFQVNETARSPSELDDTEEMENAFHTMTDFVLNITDWFGLFYNHYVIMVQYELVWQR